MPKAKLPRLTAFTIELSDSGHLHALIGTCGRLLLDSGAPANDVISMVMAARAAASVGKLDALAVLEQRGFRFVHQGRQL